MNIIIHVSRITAIPVDENPMHLIFPENIQTLTERYIVTGPSVIIVFDVYENLERFLVTSPHDLERVMFAEFIKSVSHVLVGLKFNFQ